MFLLLERLEPLFKLLEEPQSTFNGPETIMLEVSFDSLGLPLLSRTLMPLLIRMFSRLPVTRSEDANLIVHPIPMEVTQVLLMEVDNLVKLP